MLITSIELENIKSYRQVTIDLRRGTTAISGANGAGKTTLVEAIGFALFGYLPYKQEHFVREGEKNGKVVVHLVGNDGRPYTVERRCGSISRWLFYDNEANFRLEQRADVMDRLHELFGIDRERPLDSLFRDALGVPQGTFTAIFLEAGSTRKQTFDALLQIEDYKTAADYLLEPQRKYREQMQEQQRIIDQLTFETQHLEKWRQNLIDARLLDEEQKDQLVRGTQLLAANRERLTALVLQQNQLDELHRRYEDSQKRHEDSQQRLKDQYTSLESAQRARQTYEGNREHFRHHEQAKAELVRLRQAEKQRNDLRQQQANLNSLRATHHANERGWLNRLKEVELARQRLIELYPLVEQQMDLETQRDGAKSKRERYKDILANGKRLSKRYNEYQEKLGELRLKIVAIEPLVPVANLLHERSELLKQLSIKRNDRENKLKQLRDKQKSLQEKRKEYEKVADRLRKAERNIALIEEHRHEAEEMPALQESQHRLEVQESRLEGNIEGYAKSRAQSAGGQCPLLNESCLNIKQRGLISLESYFESLLQEEQAQMEQVRAQQEAVARRMTQIQKYAGWLNKLDGFLAERDNSQERIQGITQEIERLESDVDALNQELDALEQLEQQITEAERAYNESELADKKVRDLKGFYDQSAQYKEQVQQCEIELQELRQEEAKLRGSEEQLKEIEAALEKLNDPRSESRAKRELIDQEKQFNQNLVKEQSAVQEAEQQLEQIQAQLALYATLDVDIARQEALRQQSEEGHTLYLRSEEEARKLPERERAYQKQQEITDQAEKLVQEIQQRYFKARDQFDEHELNELTYGIDILKNRLSKLEEANEHQQRLIEELLEKIATAEKLLEQLEEARKIKQELEDLQTMMEHFRKLIKEAAPYVLRAMLNDISAEANRIFGEIMGDRSAQLSWENDYEIFLRRQGSKRTFAQLSGGEQMSAALSVRLALLKKLSNISIAFFDEPTQNMDELRRMNLAEQIRRVRGFDQLLVISHDDTFEQGLDSLVRLQKRSGETHLANEDGATSERNSSSGEAVLW